MNADVLNELGLSAAELLHLALFGYLLLFAGSLHADMREQNGTTLRLMFVVLALAANHLWSIVLISWLGPGLLATVTKVVVLLAELIAIISLHRYTLKEARLNGQKLEPEYNEPDTTAEH